ncbi:MAG: metallophosphoesterase [Lachnospiraceae bacterium]|nr:metallophosphoesterase [Lachnospiraceae bacterium]
MQVLIVLISIIVILMICSFVETKLLTVTSYEIGSENIPDDLDGKRIVLLSDLHNTEFGKNNGILLRKISETRPDIIIIAGDLINGNTSKKQFVYASEFFKELKELNVPVYYSFGNHECRLKGYFYNDSDFKDYVKLSGGGSILLNNASVSVGRDDNDTAGQTVEKPSDSRQDKKRTRIYGLMLPPSQFKRKAKLKLEKKISDQLGDIDKDSYNILIAHDPAYFEDYMEWGADLVVSGHIHGGIIRIPFLGGLISPRFEFFPKIDKGLFRYNDGRIMIVSGGIGWHGLPFRFLNRPEIVVLDMKKI